MTETNPPAVWWSAARGWLISERPRRDGYHVAEVRPGGDAVYELVDMLPADAVPLVPIRRSEEAIREAARDWFDPNDNLNLEEFEETAGDAVRFVLALLNNPVPAGAVPDTGQDKEIHNLLGQLADRSTSPDVLDSATEHVVRTNVRNGRPTSARFVGLVLAELDQARATRPSGDTVQAPDVASRVDTELMLLTRAIEKLAGYDNDVQSPWFVERIGLIRVLLGTDPTAVAS